MFIKAAALTTLGLLVTACASDPSTSTEHDDGAEVIGELVGVEGTVYRYDDGLYRGGDIKTQEGMDALGQLGVRTVFSVTPTDDERRFAEQAGIRLVEVPFTKTGIPAEQLPEFMEQMRAADEPLFVHCHSGSNRGGTLLAAYRIHVQGWDAEQATAEFIALGGKHDEYPELMESARAK